jgi:hypothetical protein
MRVMQTQMVNLFTIMECHFQRAIRRAMNMAVNVQIMVAINSGESEYQSTYDYYLFLFSGWWFNYCTSVALNGNYNTTIGLDFFWHCPATDRYVYPIRSEMKIRRQ